MSTPLYVSPAPPSPWTHRLPASLLRHRKAYTARYAAGDRIDLLPAYHTDLFLVEAGQVHLCCATRRLIRARFSPGDVISPRLQGDAAAELIAHTAARILRLPALLVHNVPRAERLSWPPVVETHLAHYRQGTIPSTAAVVDTRSWPRTAGSPHWVWGVVALNLCGYLFALIQSIQIVHFWPTGLLITMGLALCFALTNGPLLSRARRS